MLPRAEPMVVAGADHVLQDDAGVLEPDHRAASLVDDLLDAAQHPGPAARSTSASRRRTTSRCSRRGTSRVWTIASLLLTPTSSPGSSPRLASRRPLQLSLDEGEPLAAPESSPLRQHLPAEVLELVEQPDTHAADHASVVALPDLISQHVLPEVPGRDALGRRPMSSVAWQEYVSSPTSRRPRVVGPGDQLDARAARELLLLASRKRTGRFAAAAARFRLVRLDPLQPGLLPVDEAAGLTPSMGLTVAAHALEVDGMPHPVHAGPVDGVAQLQGELPDPEPMAAELQHLGHERQVLQLAVLVQRREDLRLAPHLDQFADAQVEDVGSEDGLVNMR